MADPTINTKASLQILRQTYTDSVFKNIVPRNTDIRDAHFSKKDIFTYNPTSKSAEAYQRLLVELFQV
jgi:chromosome partitioning protein